MQIAKATPEQAATLSQIARTAKAHWGYPAHWLEAWRDFFTIRPEQIEAHDYFVALDDGQPAGFCGVHRVEQEWWLEHLWILPEWWGRGIGRRLFDRAAECIRERGGRAMLIRADPNAEGFYLRMGAVRIGEVDATMFGVARVTPELRYAIT